MTPAELFRNSLLMGEDVTVALPSKADADYLLQLLRTEKYRSTKQLDALGMSDVNPLAGKILKYDIVETKEDSIVVRIHASTAKRVSKVSFTII